MAVRDMLTELAADYSREHAKPLVTEAAGGLDVAKRIRAGEATDIVVLSASVIDQLIADGRLLAASRVDLAQSGVGVAVRADATRCDIGSADAVKRAVLAATSIGYSTGPSGVYLERLFERWGILPQIKARILIAPPGVPVGSLIAKGDCDLGFQQLSELISLPGIRVLGPLPPEIQILTTFSGAIATTCADPAMAREVLQFMASPATSAIKLRHGLESANQCFNPLESA
jgi:molybdate transport system substrate-binding protein